jgi:NADH-quinone oxidoreductase subunit B
VHDVSKVVPVDVFVPGCPPRPEALGRAVVLLQNKIRKMKLDGEPFEPLVVT